MLVLVEYVINFRLLMYKKRDTSTKTEEANILSNPSYICASSQVITNALKQGSDVMQLPNGEIIITEYKAITVHYHWDIEKKKIIRKIKNFSSSEIKKPMTVV